MTGCSVSKQNPVGAESNTIGGLCNFLNVERLNKIELGNVLG